MPVMDSLLSSLFTPRKGPASNDTPSDVDDGAAAKKPSKKSQARPSTGSSKTSTPVIKRTGRAAKERRADGGGAHKARTPSPSRQNAGLVSPTKELDQQLVVMTTKSQAPKRRTPVPAAASSSKRAQQQGGPEQEKQEKQKQEKRRQEKRQEKLQKEAQQDEVPQGGTQQQEAQQQEAQQQKKEEAHQQETQQEKQEIQRHENQRDEKPLVETPQEERPQGGGLEEEKPQRGQKPQDKKSQDKKSHDKQQPGNQRQDKQRQEDQHPNRQRKQQHQQKQPTTTASASSPDESHGDEDMADASDPGEFSFERFLKWRWAPNGTSIEIQVQWAAGDVTWEPENNLHEDSPDALLGYWREKGGRPVSPKDPDVFDILAVRGHSANRKRLLVEWVGFGPKDATWVSRESVEQTAPAVVAEYMKGLREDSKPKGRGRRVAVGEEAKAKKTKTEAGQEMKAAKGPGRPRGRPPKATTAKPAKRRPGMAYRK